MKVLIFLQKILTQVSLFFTQVNHLILTKCFSKPAINRMYLTSLRLIRPLSQKIWPKIQVGTIFLNTDYVSLQEQVRGA